MTILTVEGEWKYLRKQCLAITRTFRRLSNLKGDEDTFGVFFQLRKNIQKLPEHPHLTVQECSCASKIDSTETCVIGEFVDKLFNLFSENNPLTLTIKKVSTDTIKLIASHAFAATEQTRTLDTTANDEIQRLVSLEIANASKGLEAQFPSTNTVRTDWLRSNGSVSISLYSDNTAQDKIYTIGFSVEQPKKPMLIKLYTKLIFLDIPRHPATFDLTHPNTYHSLPSDGFTEENIKQYNEAYLDLHKS